MTGADRKEIIRVMGFLTPVQKLAETQGDAPFATLLTSWKANLETLKTKLTTVDGLTGLKDRLTADWPETPKAFSKNLQTLTENVQARPDQTATLDAQTFLTTAQLRLGDYHEKKQGGRDRLDDREGRLRRLLQRAGT